MDFDDYAEITKNFMECLPRFLALSEEEQNDIVELINAQESLDEFEADSTVGIITQSLFPETFSLVDDWDEE